VLPLSNFHFGLSVFIFGLSVVVFQVIRLKWLSYQKMSKRQKYVWGRWVMVGIMSIFGSLFLIFG